MTLLSPAFSFRVTVEAEAPHDPGLYESIFQHKPSLVGPDELLARLIMGCIKAQNLTLGKERPDLQ